MRLTAKLTFLAFVLISVSGACMSISLNPFKKEVVLMSPLKGTLLKAGVPLINVEVEVKVLKQNGVALIRKYRTDDSGVFDLPALTESLVMGPMTEFAVSQFITVIYSGERRKIWSAGKRNEALYGELDVPGEIVDLVCDLDDSTINEVAEEEGIITVCKWKSIRRI